MTRSRRRRARVLETGLLLGCFGTWAGGLLAQEESGTTVLGRVLEAGTGNPQVGAFVALLDPVGERRVAVLTDERGRFELRVPGPGEYRLRVEGLGLETTFEGPFHLSDGQVLSRDLVVRPSAIRLEGLEVTGSARCDMDEGEGSATLQLWEEARKALEVAEWVGEVGYVYHVTSFRRVVRIDGARVDAEETSDRVLPGREAFSSLPADSLMGYGFVQPDGDATLYFAPDASVLLSDVFLSAHCFEAVREDGRLGLAFEPAPGRTLPDIRGTLWFGDELRLDHMDFRYTGLRRFENADVLGGEIRFERLPQGAWIVREWRIRMPYEVEAAQADRAQRLVRLVETGGLIREARSVDRLQPLFRSRRGAVRGIVTAPGPSEDGRVFLSGTGHAAALGVDGSFLLPDVLPGEYQLVVTHPALLAMGEPSMSRPVEVVADSIAVAEVIVPAAYEVLQDRCAIQELIPLEEPDVRTGEPRVIGGVLRDADGGPVANWPIRVRWRDLRLLERGGRLVGSSEAVRATVAFTGPAGGWVVCGLPDDESFYVDVAEAPLTPEEARAGEGRWREADRVEAMAEGAVVWLALGSGA
ncbi:MAG TPA: carboxypeptidase-like regulatory domain-containing protein [Longimicrobiales bacterium]|nr:carboxypeptidase-like regulatory domain-containing protein [Longimicrobiales bacterium]